MYMLISALSHLSEANILASAVITQFNVVYRMLVVTAAAYQKLARQGKINSRQWHSPRPVGLNINQVFMTRLISPCVFMYLTESRDPRYPLLQHFFSK